MNVIDIYDIASTTWYKQATSGPSPPIRVDPCAVVFAAPDASSFNVYLYGGQNLQPYEDQTQYSDMWILTVPSFTWIQVNLDGQSQPPARAGHTCHAWNGQMVVVGGYVGNQISCDSPGIYVFNASSLQWQNNYVALSGGNSQSEQATQDTSGSGLSGSYGYEVPGPVQTVIGGGASGSATATTPAAGQATDGPLATGRPPTFTITQSGSTIVETAHSTATATSVVSSTAPSPASNSSSSSTNIGVIIAAAIAGVLAVLAAYLAFCTWLYRRQIALYKNHVAMSQRAALGCSVSPDNRMRNEKTGALLGAFGTEIGRGSHSGSNSAPRSSLGENSGPMAVRQDSSSTANRVFTSEEPTPMEYHGAAGVAASGGGGAGPHGWPGGTSDRGSVNSSTEDLLGGQEPSFISVILSPRRTLRVINRD
jgi:hypothetical protein